MGPVSGSKSENTLHMQQSWAVCDPKKKKSSDEMVEDMIVIACNSDQLGMYDDDDSWILHWSYSWQINKLFGYFSITLLLLFYVLTLP